MRERSKTFGPAERQKVWSDTDLLRRWTIAMLRTYELHSWKVYFRDSENKQRARLRKLATDDPRRFAQLIVRYPTLAELAQKRPRGRPRHHQPGLADAWETKKFIQEKWREIFGRYYRKGLALEIAARFYGFTIDQLVNYGKNKNRCD